MQLLLNKLSNKYDCYKTQKLFIENLYFCAVKFPVFIYMLYILVLPCFPCSDSDECEQSTTAVSIRPDQHKGHAHQDETCNPFCSCACCGQTLYPSFYLEKIVVSTPTGDTLHLAYSRDSAFPTGYPVNIWQPPRLS